MKSTYPTVNSQRLLTLFEQLISFDSPTYGERKICDFLKNRLTALGVVVQEDDAGARLKASGHIPACETDSTDHNNNIEGSGNLYGFLEGTLDLPPLLLSAHMDTVEPSCGKQIETAPDGTITSKGNTVLGADDCAGLTAILEALTVIKENNLPHRPIEIIFSAAEEAYCIGISHFDFSKIRSTDAYVFDMSGPVGSAAYQAPMILSFEIVFTGRSAHAGFEPENGIHAIKAAALAVSRISCGHVGDSTVNIGTIAGGNGNNIVPGNCTITGEIRSYSDDEAYALLNEISDIAKDSSASIGTQVEIQHTVHFHAYCVTPDQPVISRFENVCKKLGFPFKLRQTFGGSDNNYLSHHGINGLVVATAMNNCHSCEEFTTEQELERAAALALSLILSDN